MTHTLAYVVCGPEKERKEEEAEKRRYPHVSPGPRVHIQWGRGIFQMNRWSAGLSMYSC
jgi:hypothetical protein